MNDLVLNVGQLQRAMQNKELELQRCEINNTHLERELSVNNEKIADLQKVRMTFPVVYFLADEKRGHLLKRVHLFSMAGFIGVLENVWERKLLKFYLKLSFPLQIVSQEFHSSALIFLMYRARMFI